MSETFNPMLPMQGPPLLFAPDPAVYAEFALLIVGGWLATRFIDRNRQQLRQSANAAPSAPLPPLTLFAVGILSVMFAMLCAAVALQATNLGNLLTTTLGTVLVLFYFLTRVHAWGRDVAVSALATSADVLRVCLLAMLGGWVVAILDSYWITPDFEVGVWLSSTPGLSPLVSVVLPVAIVLAIRASRVGWEVDPYFGYTHGWMAFILACAAAMAMADLVRVPLLSEVLPAIMLLAAAAVGPTAGSPARAGAAAAARVALIVAWLPVSFTPIVAYGGMRTSYALTWALTTAAVALSIYWRRRMPESSAHAGLATLFAVTFAARVGGGLTAQLLGFGLLPIMAAAILGGGALYIVQFRLS